MSSKQQEETLNFFKGHAEAWEQKSETEIDVNVIAQRNNYVLHVIKSRNETKSCLDVGCGTGNLAIDIAKEGIHAVGMDFAGEMIDIANERAKKVGVENVEFQTASIFDIDFGDTKYDVISANGFIEYISLEQLKQFMDTAREVLTPGGHLVLGSRNMLFNIFSLNSFTNDEIEGGTAIPLLKEAVSVAQMNDLSEIHTFEHAPLQDADKTHEHTGIGVTTRFQYTPAQLANLGKEHGYTTKEIFPVHYHGMPVRAKETHMETHVAIANELYGNNNPALIPYASTFMISLEKSS